MPHKQMGPVDVNGDVHTAASNIKGKTFKFAQASRPASCVDWAQTKQLSFSMALSQHFDLGGAHFAKGLVEPKLLQLQIPFFQSNLRNIRH